MKRIIIFLTVMMLSVFFCVIAEASDVPEDVYQYASTTGFDGLKSFIKSEDNGYIGNLINSSEDADNLVLGKGYRVYYFDPEKLGDKSIDKLSEVLCANDKWRFTADTPSGESVAFLWVYKKGDTLSNGGGGSAELFNKGRKVMEGVIKANNDSAEPILIEYGSYFIFVYHTDDNDYVLPILGDAVIDESFLQVTNYKQLPTGSDLIEQVNANYEESLTQPDTICGGAALTLKADINMPDSNLPNHLIITVIAICATAAAGAIIVIVHKKVKQTPSVQTEY